jgi:hypothetical protein
MIDEPDESAVLTTRDIEKLLKIPRQTQMDLRARGRTFLWGTESSTAKRLCCSGSPNRRRRRSVLMADMTTPRAEQPGDATEINRRQTTDIPNGIGGDRVGEGVERADVRLFLDAEEPPENAADEGGEEGSAK